LVSNTKVETVLVDATEIELERPRKTLKILILADTGYF
jgi:hypothetical protein